MDQDILDGLNEMLSIEYTSMIQLLQHSYVMQGVEREVFADKLADHAKDTVKHAKELGDKIAVLGAVPTVQIGAIRQSTDPYEMMQQDLEQHEEAVAKINAMVAKCDERKLVALRVLLEEMSYEETLFIEELRRALSLMTVSVQERPGRVPRVKVS